MQHSQRHLSALGGGGGGVLIRPPPMSLLGSHISLDAPPPCLANSGVRTYNPSSLPLAPSPTLPIPRVCTWVWDIDLVVCTYVGMYWVIGGQC